MVNKYFLGLLLCFVIFFSNAQTFHFLAIADTKDRYIGKSCEQDLKSMSQEIEKIAQNCGFTLKKYIFKDSLCNSNVVLAKVKKITCQKNDVLFLYYTGHGRNTNNSFFPKMLIKGKKSLFVESLHQSLKRKNARLTISLAEACNYAKNTSNRISERDILQNPDFIQLFLQYRGDILASSSQKGQYTYNNDYTGGFFTNCWIRNLEKVASQKNPTWEEIFERSKICTQNMAFSVDLTQTPQYKINSSKQLIDKSVKMR